MATHSCLLSRFLKELGIKYNSDYAELQYQRNPYKFTLYGLSIMLSKFNISNEALRIEDPKKAFEIPQPFIAEINNDLAIVKALDKDNASIDWYGEDVTLPTNSFLDMWSGVALLAHPNENSIEPNYASHLKFHMRRWLHIVSICFLVFLLWLYLGSYHNVFGMSAFYMQVLSNGIGCAFSIMLLRKQLHMDGAWEERLCNIWKSGHCNTVQKNLSEFPMGRFPWSEIGVTYFFVNLMVVTVVPAFWKYWMILAIGSILFAVWSIGYQYARIHTWCLMCIGVQLVLMSQCALALCVLVRDSVSFSFKWNLPILLLMMYLMVFVIIHLIIPFAEELYTNRSLSSQYKFLLGQKDVFNALQHRQHQFSTDEASSLLFGDRNSQFKVTIFSNVYCGHCSVLHESIRKLLQDGCLIQYVFSTFNNDAEKINKLVISAYLKLGPEATFRILDDWYTHGKYMGETFFDRYDLDTKEAAVDEELQKHQQWQKETGFVATPLVLVNGRRLAYPYRIEELNEVIEYWQ